MIPTRDTVKEMAALRDQGKTFAELSIIFNLSQGRVSKWIRNYRTYGDSLWTVEPEAISCTSDQPHTDCTTSS